MKTELTKYDLALLNCCLFATITDLKERKRRDHLRYGEEFDERHEWLIQKYTALAEKIYDMMED